MRRALRLSILAIVGTALLALTSSTAHAQRDAGAKIRQEFGMRGVPGRGPAVAAPGPGYGAFYRGYYRAPQYRTYYRAPQYRTYYRYSPQRGYYVAPYRGHRHHSHHCY